MRHRELCAGELSKALVRCRVWLCRPTCSLIAVLAEADVAGGAVTYAYLGHRRGVQRFWRSSEVQ